MSRLLTQEEVDALLAMDDGPAEPVETTTLREEGAYDLRAPVLLAGERMILAQERLDAFAAELASALDLLILAEAPSEGCISGLVQQPASTVLDTLPDHALLGVLVNAHGQVQGGIALPVDLALPLVDRLLGGDGAVSGLAQRALTEVERDLLEHSLVRVVATLAGGVLPEGTALATLEHEPQRGALARRRGALCCAQIRMQTPLAEGVCRFVATGELVAAILRVADAGARPAPSQAIFEALVEAPLRVDAVLPAGALSLSDLVRLEPGHVIELDADEKDAGLRAGGRLLAQGEITHEGRRRVFRIERIDDEGSRSADSAGEETR